jgi:hypothetical protein
MTSVVNEIEVTIEKARAVIERNNALDRLFDNPDFVDVIRNGYLHEEAVRLVHLKAAPQMQKPEHQTDVLRAIDSIGGLLGYFQKIGHASRMAEQAIEQGEQALQEIEDESMRGEDE